MEAAERISREEHCSNKLLVISGVGTYMYMHMYTYMSISTSVFYIRTLTNPPPIYIYIYTSGTRHYYRRMGYELDGPYMSKSLL